VEYVSFRGWLSFERARAGSTVDDADFPDIPRGYPVFA